MARRDALHLLVTTDGVVPVILSEKQHCYFSRQPQMHEIKPKHNYLIIQKHRGIIIIYINDFMFYNLTIQNDKQKYEMHKYWTR